MSEHVVAEHGHAAEHAHPSPGKYIQIGVILFFLTVAEVSAIYIGMPTWLLIMALMILMAVKFSLVVMYFMHLKFDHPLFSALFTAPLLIAVSIGLALMALFGAFIVAPHGGHLPLGGGPGGAGH